MTLMFLHNFRVRVSLVLVLAVVGISIDCPKTINLALGMNMNLRSPSTMTSLYSDCCLAPGVTCDGVSRVTQIDWSYYGLDGVINSTAIPPKLTVFNMHGDSLGGAFPTTLPVGLTTFDIYYCNFGGSFPSNFPAGLTILSLFNNYFTGPIASFPPALSFLSLGLNYFSGNIPTIPVGLTYLGLQYNNFTGPIPSNLPSTLTKINIGANGLTGSIPQLPAGLKFLGLYGNYITGSVPLTWPVNITYINVGPNMLTGTITNVNWPSTLTDLQVDGNYLTGELPQFPAGIQILHLGFPNESANQFTGTLKVNRPTEMSITNNWITNILISNSSLLTFCDISYNPLFGNPNIASLTMCTATGLYNASTLPNTITTQQASKTTKLVISSSIKAQTSATIAKSTSGSISTPSTLLKSNSKTSGLLGTSKISTRNTVDSSTSTQQVSLVVLGETPQKLFQSQSTISSEVIYNTPVIHTDTYETFSIYSTENITINAIAVSETWYSILKIVTRLLVNSSIMLMIVITAPFMRELRKKVRRVMGKPVEDTTFGRSK